MNAPDSCVGFRRIFCIMGNGRIEIFDFMKGFCIAMVIADHCNLHFESVHIQNMLDAVRMPLY